MKNRGFTLIELLAVIVILAIIALIATPIVLGIIEDARDQANKRSIDMYGRAVEQAVVRYQLNNAGEAYGQFTYYIDTDGKKDGKIISNGSQTLNIEHDGAEVLCEIIIIQKEGNIYLNECRVDGIEVDHFFGKATYINTSPSINGDTTGELNITENEIVKTTNAKVTILAKPSANEYAEYKFPIKNAGTSDIYLVGIEFKTKNLPYEIYVGKSKTSSGNTLISNISNSVAVLEERIVPGETIYIIAKISLEDLEVDESINISDMELYFRTTTETVAEQKLGDVNADGFINRIDLDYISKKAAGWDIDYNVEVYGDVDCNGSIEIGDVSAMENYLKNPSQSGTHYIGQASCPVSQ